MCHSGQTSCTTSYTSHIPSSSSITSSPTTSSPSSSPSSPNPRPQYDHDFFLTEPSRFAPPHAASLTKPIRASHPWHSSRPTKSNPYCAYLRYKETPPDEYDLLKSSADHPDVQPFSLRDAKIHISSLTDLYNALRRPVTWTVGMAPADRPVTLCRVRIAAVRVFVTRKCLALEGCASSERSSQGGGGEGEEKRATIEVTSKDVRRWVGITIDAARQEYENMTGINETDDAETADSLRANFKKNALVKDMCGGSVCKSEEDGGFHEFWWHVDRDVQGIVEGEMVRMQPLEVKYLDKGN